MPDEKKDIDLSKRKVYKNKNKGGKVKKDPLYQHHLNNVKNNWTYKWPEGGPNAGKESSLYTTTVGTDTGVMLLPRVWRGKLLSVKAAVEKAKATGTYKIFPDETSAQTYNDNLPFRKETKKKDK